MKYFKEVGHLKAIHVILSELTAAVPDDHSLQQQLYESKGTLDEYSKTHGMKNSCYRKRTVYPNEELDVLCEIAIPPKNGDIAECFRFWNGEKN